MKKIALFCYILFSFSFCFADDRDKASFLNRDEPKLLKLFIKSYPDVKFQSEFDKAVDDWKIEISANGKSETLYWAEAKFLPLKELKNKELYSSYLYHYPKSIPDPKDFSEEDIQRIKSFSAKDNRTENKGTAPFLYNLIYDVETRISTESHISSHKFLNKKCNAHDFIHKKLDLVQKDIFKAAKADTEVKKFLETLLSADSYAWRVISDSGNRSFHSMGLAIDVLPKGWGTKNLYWAWRRDIDKDNWMMLPLERRWMPPAKVIEIFEAHGFLWGGKWIIWDNMHFEYRPEVILYNK